MKETQWTRRMMQTQRRTSSLLKHFDTDVL